MRQIHRDRRETGSFLGLGVERKRVAVRRQRDSFWGNENDLKLIMVMDVQLCEYTKATELYT